jgi:UDP-N-acetylglucosamine 3-dehydrogenase
MRQIGLGIIGCGAISQRAYLPAFAEPGSALAARAMRGHSYDGCPKSKVVALADINEPLARRLAAEFDVPKTYTDWHELVNDSNVEAVCVATPNHLHAEMAIEAMKCGKHVLVEKPMATDLTSMDQMVSLATERKLVLMVNQAFRFNPVHEVAKDVVDSGLIGKTLSVRGRFGYAGPESWTGSSDTWWLKKSLAGGGALYDVGIHAVDLIRYLTGKEVVEVAAFCGALERDIQTEDNAVCIMRFSDGTLGVAEASWTTRPGQIVTQICGSEGNLTVDMGEGSATEAGDEVGPVLVQFAPPATTYMNMRMPPGVMRGSVFVPSIPGTSRYGGPYRHFVDCVESGAVPVVSGNEGRASMEIVLAAIASQETHKVIRLPLKR